jgi:hypothetical protein
MEDTEPVLKINELVVAPVNDETTEFVKVVTDLLLKKPQTKSEALELFHDLMAKLEKWVVKDLPAADQNLALLGLRAVEEVTSFSCWPRK